MRSLHEVGVVPHCSREFLEEPGVNVVSTRSHFSQMLATQSQAYWSVMSPWGMLAANPPLQKFQTS